MVLFLNLETKSACPDRLRLVFRPCLCCSRCCSCSQPYLYLLFICNVSNDYWPHVHVYSHCEKCWLSTAACAQHCTPLSSPHTVVRKSHSPVLRLQLPLKQRTAIISAENFAVVVCLKRGGTNLKSHVVLMVTYCYGRFYYCCQHSYSTGADRGSSGTGLCCASLPLALQTSASQTAALRWSEDWTGRWRRPTNRMSVRSVVW